MGEFVSDQVVTGLMLVVKSAACRPVVKSAACRPSMVSRVRLLAKSDCRPALSESTVLILHVYKCYVHDLLFVQCVMSKHVLVSKELWNSI